MTITDVIKNRIQKLYETAPQVHVSVMIPHTRTVLENDLAEIKGVYRNVFRLEERSSGILRCHTVKYADIITKQIRIAELQDLNI